MSEHLGWEDMNILERFQNAKEHTIDDVPAALLVLADSIERAMWHVGITDNEGQLNVRLSGDIETEIKGGERTARVPAPIAMNTAPTKRKSSSRRSKR